MSYYVRKNNRRATVDAAIDDNWVELNVPEPALATSPPAIDAFPGGRTGAHVGRIGVTLSNAVPHGISQANPLLHAQTARRGTRNSTFFNGSSNWRVWNGERKESNRTLSAVAVASSVATVFALASDPGSRRQTRSRWFDILPEEHTESVEGPNDCAASSEGSSISDGSRTATTDSEPLSSPDYGTHSTPNTEVSSSSPTCGRFGIPPPIRIPNATTSDHGRRASSLPIPSGYVQSEDPESSQIVMIDSRNPLFESPAPITSNTTASFSAQQRGLGESMSSARSIIEGLRRLFDVVDHQPSTGYASTVPSPQNAYCTPRAPYTPDVPIPAEDLDWEMCSLTPATVASSWHTADPRERKLLIIGSGYESAKFRQATLEANATLATLTTLNGVSHDVKSLTSVFKKRSFIVENLLGDWFDAQTILTRVKTFLSDATEGDVRAIVFTGHAARTQADHKVAIVPPAGYHGANPDDGLISADAWRATVHESTQPGVVVLSIFASCMSGDLMDQPINLKDLNGPIATSALSDPKSSAPGPIFITFASSRSDQSTYESVVGPSRGQDNPFRYGDHFLRAFTLAARESHISDWKGFIQALEENFSELRRIGAICAANDPDMQDLNWERSHPQTPIYTSSRFNLPLLDDVMPRGIIFGGREPPTPIKRINLTEEFLAHISLFGETPEITHYTLPNAK
ncbi:hypothetical protein B0J17DRAFT_719168 [Rhizoctonia solani]|nr:hypothetical protein B0J17DRAFT_719168 [Rhizoctonia solani]